MSLRHFLILFILIWFNCTILFSQWYQQNSNTNRPLRTVYFIDSITGWAGGSNRTMLKTSNGGSNWTVLTTGTATGFVNSIYFINAFTGWAACAYDSLLKTTNGGISWTAYHGNTYDDLLDVFFVNPQTGWVVGFLGITRKTTNSGLSWNSYYSTIWSLNSVYFVNELTGWIAGGGSRAVILKSTNGGVNWTTQLDTASMGFWKLSMLNSNSGYAVGGTQLGSYLYKTTNGGSNWYQLDVPISTGLKALSFANVQTGWAAGNLGKMIKTTNSGSNWAIQSTFSNFDFWQLFFINSQTGWGVGSPNVILKTTNGGEPIGIEPYSNYIPKNYIISQNFPNPFNPKTLIKFDIPERSYVNLLVYDVLGKEIESLVSEELNAGQYSIDWNADNYTSGVYFYKLIAEGFIETKKMILLK